MTFKLVFDLPYDVPVQSEAASTKPSSPKTTHSREVLSARLTSAFPEILGITEGTMHSEEAHSLGYETESWVLDEGMAPHERDWISQQESSTFIAYFNDEGLAQKALRWLMQEYDLNTTPVIEIEPEQDWNATWKAAFTGIDVSPELRILPPWSDEWLNRKPFHAKAKAQRLVGINPGAGFGTGTHETTQMCLQTLLQLKDLTGKTVLDFGSGSGILGIVAALMGANVTCVEIDQMANDNAAENAEMNGVNERVRILTEIPEDLKNGKVDILLANILRPILLRFAPVIKNCLKPDAELVLSGLIESDVAEVVETYQQGGAPFRTDFKIAALAKNEWRALRLRRGNT